MPIKEAIDPVNVNVYDIETKKIIFTGSQSNAGKHIGVSTSYINRYLTTKGRIKNKYAVRYCSEVK